MKRGLILVLLIAIFAINFSVAEIVSDSLHLNIQVTNSSGIATGTFNFGFNISNTNGCNTGNIIYADAISLATDDRGIISHYLDNVNLNFSEQYWLCYYRNNVLISTSKIARTPYSFKAKNTTTSGIIADADLSLGSYGLTTNNGWLNGGVSILDGDIYAQSLFVYNISSINVNNININGSLYPPISASFDIGSSTLRWKDLYLSGTATAGSLLHLSSGSPVEVWLDQTGGGNTNRKISSSGSSMIFYSDATEQARFDAAGDFGIGTNGEPYHPLTLLRDGSSPTLSLDRSGIGTFHLGVASDGSGVIATNDATGSGPQNISIRTGVTYNNDITSTGYELLKIRQDGNLGLNVTNPLGKLHIGHSGDGYKISNLISPPPGTFYMNGGNSTSSDAGQIIIGDNLLNWKLHIGAVDPLESTYYDIMTIKTGSGAQSSQVNIADYLNVSNFVFADSDSLGVGMSPLPGTYAFQIKPSTNAMNVSGVLYVDGTSGRVGIGTSTPTHTLNVVGSANITENLTVTDKIGIGIDPTGAYQMHIDTANNFISGTSQSGANGRFAMQYTTAGGINRFRYDSAGIVDVSLGTVIFPDAVFVDNSNGFVGIGIMTPTTTLMINSSGTNGVDIGANSANKENSGELFFSNGTSGKSFGIVKTGSRLGFAYGATPGSGSGTPIMYMTELGNVGIGPLLLNPNARLEISKGGYLGEGIFELNVSGVLYVNATQQALTLIGNQTMSGAITTGQGANPVVNAWNHFGTGGKDNANIADVNDVYISDDLEVDGTAFIPATGGTSGAYWTVGDVAENMLTIEGRNSLLCKNNSKYCTGKPYNHGELDFGDVACIDPRYGQVIMKCKNSETDIPVGVVSSTASMIIGGDADYETGYPVGVAGFVPTKVSNENGGIYPGDLLVLSATKPGYAMKQMGIKNYSGMIIGSAYDFCDGRYNEECKIPVLIALSYTKDFQEEINILKEQYKRFNSFFEKIDKICSKNLELCE